MTLETEERVEASGRAIRTLHGEHSETTLHALAASFVFTVPPAASPSFRTPMVGLHWLLRFELTAGTPPPATGRGAGGPWRTESLQWALPLVVHPPAEEDM